MPDKNKKAEIMGVLSGLMDMDGGGEEAAPETLEEAEPVPEKLEGVPEGLEDIADLKGRGVPRRNAAHPEYVKTVTKTRKVTYGTPPEIREKEEAEREEAERKAKEEETARREEARAAREALRASGSRRVARVVYVDEEPKSKRVLVLMQPTLYEAAKEAAEEDGVSANEYINQALREKILKSEED